MPSFEILEQQPEDAIFGVNKAYQADNRSTKCNLSIGVYKNSMGQSILLKTVQKAEEKIQRAPTAKNYLPMSGDSAYINLSKELIFGKEHSALTQGRIAACQTVGGSGALRVGGELLSRFITKKIYISTPAWPNHRQIFSMAGMEVEYYPYYNEVTKGLDFGKLKAAVQEMPEGSVILLQASCHNPTGIDPSFSQWQELSDLIKKQKLIPFFDLAYQGFGEGLDKDAQSVRYFAEQGHDMLVASSNSKNFGLYGERVGLLSVISAKPDTTPIVQSNLQKLIRGNYSNPPTHGAKIITTILSDPELKEEWVRELTNMKERIQNMRNSLIAGLQAKGKNGEFNFMNSQKGMFSYSGLDQDQVHRLRVESGIYMPKDGRINVAGLNSENINYITEAILSVCEE